MSGGNGWNESLFGCFDDMGTCCCGYWCTPCLFGKNSEKISGKNCCLMCCAYSLLAHCYLCWLLHLFERKQLRENFNLPEDSACNDIIATLCCGPCALCQEAREMKSREGGAAYRANMTVVSQPLPAQAPAQFNVYRV